ncbi:MAG: carbohydrate ABC transporter permease [Firmicutes bacterium]|nr:carbohydrate ABC transporter permease [Bacillota bacterium]
MNSRKKVGHRSWNEVWPWIVLGILMVITYFPLYWLASMSFKTRIDIITLPPKWTFKPTASNYKWVLGQSSIKPAIQNSLMVAILTTALACLFGVPTAYGLSRFSFKSREKIESWILTIRMLPPVAVIIPFYMIWTSVKLYDSYMSLVVTYLVINLPLFIWLMKGFFQDLPKEVEEAAQLDGCSHWGALLQVALPACLSGFSVAAMLTFLFTWNEFFFAFVLTSTKATLPVAVASFMTHGLETKYGEMAAAGVIASIPALLFLIFCGRLLGRGLSGLIKMK